MTAQDVLNNILKTSLINYDLRYCLVDENKRPHKLDGEFARPNNIEDFSKLSDVVSCEKLNDYRGLGISIQASNICAIDVDHCFFEKNNLNSADERALDILNRFKDIAYCEFSFSGTGLRIIFNHDIIDNYSEKYYIKNSTNSIEFYQPSNSYRYVTITGNSIYEGKNNDSLNEKLFDFFESYMKRPNKIKKEIKKLDSISFEDSMKKVKYLYYTNNRFQDLWFGTAPGSGKDESERDYHLICLLYEKITHDSELLKKIFEQSPYFKSKDYKHLNKWRAQDNRYFNYIYHSIITDYDSN